MSRKQHTRNASGPMGPSQRQLRAGELIRHALVEVLREEEIHDPRPCRASRSPSPRCG